jgi:hypothetical protein
VYEKAALRVGDRNGDGWLDRRQNHLSEQLFATGSRAHRALSLVVREEDRRDGVATVNTEHRRTLAGVDVMYHRGASDEAE